MKKKRLMTNGILIGTFLFLYLLIMGLATYFVKEDFVADYAAHLFQKTVDLAERMSQESDFVIEQSKKEKDRELSYLNYMLSINNQGLDQYQQISMAIYDTEANLYTQTSDMFGNSLGMYQVNHYFTEEELDEIIRLYLDSLDDNNVASLNLVPHAFYVSLYYCQGYEEPMGVELKSFGSGEVLWSWTNVMAGPDGYSNYGEERSGNIFLPYIEYGKNAWEKWNQNRWLQDFPPKEEFTSTHLEYFNMTRKEPSMIQSMGTHIDCEDKNGRVQTLFQWGNVDKESDSTVSIITGQQNHQEEIYTLELRQTIHPWLAAMDYMKYVYLGGLILILICLSIVFYTFRKSIKEQKELENQRRDFINAAAHELKTPLGIIRGFAENVKENTVEEKRDYYLDQIISQTEVMDGLVKEMIGLSKMDSIRDTVGREKVSVKDLLEEQIEKLIPLLENSKITLEKQLSVDFELEGDVHLLEKAFWNLLENGVVHNVSKGWIRVTLTEDFCMIENSGNPIPEEDLGHIKEMFYTGDESRHDSRNHRGLGLYLADQIFEMHGLEMNIANRTDGVMVTVERKG